MIVLGPCSPPRRRPCTSSSSISSRWPGRPPGRGPCSAHPRRSLATRELAFNQGFYNLFLAAVTGIGIVAWVAGSGVVGASLMLAGVGSMAAAALVPCSSPAPTSGPLRSSRAPCPCSRWLRWSLALTL